MDQSYYPDGFLDLLLDATPLPKDIIQLIQICCGPSDVVRQSITFATFPTWNTEQTIIEQCMLDQLFNIYPLEIVRKVIDYDIHYNDMWKWHPQLERGEMIPILNIASDFCRARVCRILAEFVSRVIGSRKRCLRVLKLHKSYITLLLQSKNFVPSIIGMSDNHILRHILALVRTADDLKRFIEEPQALFITKRSDGTWYLGKYKDRSKRKGPGVVVKVNSKFSKKPKERDRSLYSYGGGGGGSGGLFNLMNWGDSWIFSKPSYPKNKPKDTWTYKIKEKIDRNWKRSGRRSTYKTY